MSKLTEQLARKYGSSKILILGWGREGQSTYHLLKKVCPDSHLVISDQNEDSIHTWQNTHGARLTTSPYLMNLSSFDVIFKTPGIPTHLKELQSFVENGGQLTSQLNEFLAVYRQQTIGVTGTKGKSTTSSMISHLCQSVGKPTLFAGNIGTPVFDIDVEVSTEVQLVLEMSSYQLDSVQYSPHIAVWLNFFPEHLNYHQTLSNYVHAKANITHFQTKEDVLIFNQDIEEMARISRGSKAKLLPFSYKDPIHYPESVQRVMAKLTEIELPLTIKKWNVLPAILAATELGVSDQEILSALKTFKPLPHRLETVGIFGEVTWIDDTLATIPEATIAALEILPRVDVLLLGGYDRGISFEKIVDVCVEKRVPAIGFFKPSGETMYNLLRQKYPENVWPKMEIVDSMEEAVRFAYNHAPQNGVVLLSPSSPSFGQFRDYQDKSEQFRNWIKQLAPSSE